MNNLKIDEDFLKSLAKDAQKVVDFISDEIRIIKDKNEDALVRYFAMMMLVNIKAQFHLTVDYNIANRQFGMQSQHPFFKTDHAEKIGWSSENKKIEENPFFVQEEESDQEDDRAQELKEELKKILKQVFD